MVTALGPGKFYGNSLPRPFFHSSTDGGEDGCRVDPPASVLDPLLSWAEEAHWSMGGLSFARRRLQGRIEGSIKRLRKQMETKERAVKRQKRSDLAAVRNERNGRMKRLAKMEEEEEELVEVDFSDDSEPKAAEELILESEGEEEEEEVVRVSVRSSPSGKLKKRARNLAGEFDEAAVRDLRSETRRTRASAARMENKKRSSPSSSSPVSSAPKPIRRGKGETSVVVTPRRSSRISPGKKTVCV